MTSLSYNYEEAAAHRIVELAEDRQVIVFTHRPFLVRELLDWADGEGVEHSLIAVSRSPVDGLPGFPIEGRFLFDSKPCDKALNAFQNEELPRLAKLVNEDLVAAHAHHHSLAASLRALVERVVEECLFQRVVERFKGDVQTLRFKDLRQIESRDVHLLESLMSRYSAFVHAVRGDAPAELPSSDQMSKDVQSLLDLYAEIKQRPKLLTA